MAKANPYDPSDRTIESISYVVSTTGDRWFIPTTGYGDNADSGTTAQQLSQCTALAGKKADGATDIATEVVA